MKKIFSTLLFFIMTFLSLGCNSETDPDPAAVERTVERPDPIDEIIKKMSLTEKIGQMVMIGIHGTDVDEDSLYMLRQFHFGGIILYKRNIESIAQTAQFVDHIQKQADEKVPLFIAIDEEGGRVTRLGHLIDAAPSQQSIGQSGSIEENQKWVEHTIKNLKSIGVNVNFAPVADVQNADRSFGSEPQTIADVVAGSDERSFGSDPQTVADFVDSSARTYENGGMIYCLKHFPGIGKGVVNSHEEISSIDVSLKELDQIDLVPFRRVIDNHPHDRFMVMLTHIKYPAIDPDNSASLSYGVQTGLLRNKLGFDGIIITDDLEMGATANHNLFSEVGVKAIQAGADIVLVCHEYSHEQSVYLGILEAVKRGDISEERINESVKRILRTKLNNIAIDGAN